MHTHTHTHACICACTHTHTSLEIIDDNVFYLIIYINHIVIISIINVYTLQI